jgi:hypothetical protein
MMNTLLLTLFVCGEKSEDTGFFDTLEDTANEETNTEDTPEDTDTNTEDTNTDEVIDILGTFSDFWGGTQIITETTWSDGYGFVFNISQIDNEMGYLLAQNDMGNNDIYENDEDFGGLWSKFQWTLNENGGLYYCQSIYNASSEEDAMGANADPADLEMGCGGFGWTELRTQLDLNGDYIDNFGTPHNINAFTWMINTSMFHILESSNDEDWAVAQNDAVYSYDPDMYSKFEWMTDAEGVTYYCQTAYNATSPEEAKAAMADKADLETGCGGFSWSSLTAQGQ